MEPASAQPGGIPDAVEGDGSEKGRLAPGEQEQSAGEPERPRTCRPHELVEHEQHERRRETLGIELRLEGEQGRREGEADPGSDRRPRRIPERLRDPHHEPRVHDPERELHDDHREVRARVGEREEREEVRVEERVIRKLGMEPLAGAEALCEVDVHLGIDDGRAGIRNVAPVLPAVDRAHGGRHEEGDRPDGAARARCAFRRHRAGSTIASWEIAIRGTR